MTDTETAALNRRVAEFLGAYCVVEPAGFGRTTHKVWRLRSTGARLIRTGGLPDFCRDPAAADLVRQEIEKRDWFLMLEYDRPHPVSSGLPRRWECQISHGSEVSFAYAASPHEALCLAFVAACEAEKAGEVVG